MSPDRTAPAGLRPAQQARATTRETPADGFAELLGAAGRTDEPRPRPSHVDERPTCASERRDRPADADEARADAERTGGEPAAEVARPAAAVPARPPVGVPE